MLDKANSEANCAGIFCNSSRTTILLIRNAKEMCKISGLLTKMLDLHRFFIDSNSGIFSSRSAFKFVESVSRRYQASMYLTTIRLQLDHR